MRYRVLDNDLDYTLGKKPQEAFCIDSEAVIQAVVTRLNLLLEEWWEDLDEGLPLLQKMLGQYNRPEENDLLITERILGTQGVKMVYDIVGNRDPNTRHYTYSATIETVYGDTETITLEFDGVHFVRSA